jgi:hypothetical protein
MFAAAAGPAGPAARTGGAVIALPRGVVDAGDLRSFLLSAPKGADDDGDPDGSVLTVADLAVASTDGAGTRGALTAYGFRAGACRTYLTADGTAEVTVKPARFAGPDQAAGYCSSLSHSHQGAAIDLGGTCPARGYHLASGSAESSDAEPAVSYQGDVQITRTVTGGQDADGTRLRDLLDAQYQRLATGR